MSDTEMDDPVGEIIDFDAPFMFASSIEVPFTKTPANVKQDDIIKNSKGKAAAAASKSTPASAKPSAKKRKAAATVIDDADDEDDFHPRASTGKKSKATPTAVQPKQKRQRKTGVKNTSSRQIPRSLDECDEADTTLIELRDAGKDWTTIRARWQQITGEKTATSTLPSRYARLKSNFTVIKEEDNGILDRGEEGGGGVF